MQEHSISYVIFMSLLLSRCCSRSRKAVLYWCSTQKKQIIFRRWEQPIYQYDSFSSIISVSIKVHRVPILTDMLWQLDPCLNIRLLLNCELLEFNRDTNTTDLVDLGRLMAYMEFAERLQWRVYHGSKSRKRVSTISAWFYGKHDLAIPDGHLNSLAWGLLCLL